MSLEALLGRAYVHEAAFEWNEAFSCYAAASLLEPGDHRILANQGNVAWLAGSPQQAHAAYRQALLMVPGCPISLRGLGNALRDLGQFEAADRAYAESRRLDPDPLTAWNHSQVLIGLGRYHEAYATAERRFGIHGQPWYRSGPFWDGSFSSLSAAGAPLKIWSEQGLGDTLQYMRWIPRLMARLPAGARVPILEVEPSLVRLLERGLSGLPRLPAVTAKTEEDPQPCAGPHLSLLSLPHHLGGAPHPDLAPTDAYLKDPAWVANRFEGSPRRVGLVWAAGRKLEDPFQAREYRQRSLPPEALERLLAGLRQRRLAVVNLQVGVDRNPPPHLHRHIQEAMPASLDFADTASFVAGLDRVITVDTAMAHLLGALALPGWVLLPFSADPRWHRGCDRTPWYAHLRLFRQPALGDWGSVIQAVLEALDAEAAGEL
jgi:tetratricopeptide (TPR) repeat protein